MPGPSTRRRGRVVSYGAGADLVLACVNVVPARRRTYLVSAFGMGRMQAGWCAQFAHHGAVGIALSLRRIQRPVATRARGSGFARGAPRPAWPARARRACGMGRPGPVLQRDSDGADRIAPGAVAARRPAPVTVIDREMIVASGFQRGSRPSAPGAGLLVADHPDGPHGGDPWPGRRPCAASGDGGRAHGPDSPLWGAT